MIQSHQNVSVYRRTNTAQPQTNMNEKSEDKRPTDNPRHWLSCIVCFSKHIPLNGGRILVEWYCAFEQTIFR